MWMEKQNIYMYNKILFSFKNTVESEIYYNMDKPWGHFAEWSQLQKDKPCMIPFIFLLQCPGKLILKALFKVLFLKHE